MARTKSLSTRAFDMTYNEEDKNPTAPTTPDAIPALSLPQEPAGAVRPEIVQRLKHFNGMLVFVMV
jgi:hypothetical protein